MGSSTILDASPRTRPRILVVVDDDEAAEALRSGLGAEGYAVATVPDCGSALALAETHPPAAIVVCGNARMPGGATCAETWQRVSRAPGTLISLGSSDAARARSLVRRSLAES